MGDISHKKRYCAYCGCYKREDLRFCENCGGIPPKRFDEYTGEKLKEQPENNNSEKYKSCKNGHRIDDSELQYCPICGLTLSACAENQSIKRKDTIRCQNCSYENPIDAVSCIKCGYMIKEKVCKNCLNLWREGDKYCRYCGAPLDNPDYRIKEFYTIYGPRPVRRKHTCKNCNNKWETDLMIDKEEHCPKCGATAEIVEIEDDTGPMYIKPKLKSKSVFQRLFGRGRKNT